MGFKEENETKKKNMRVCIKYNLISFIVFYATFSNISAMSWRPVVEEAGVPVPCRRKTSNLWWIISECFMKIKEIMPQNERCPQ
jgi:hypothetical protein